MGPMLTKHIGAEAGKLRKNSLNIMTTDGLVHSDDSNEE